jgi:DNA-binding MarR family transcriptional regulator
MDGFDIDQIDDVIHGRIRLGVMAFLASAGKADFADLKHRLGATDGNLSIHLKKLEEAGYVTAHKAFVGKKPLTTLAITDTGRNAYDRWLQVISALVAGNMAQEPASKIG